MRFSVLLLAFLLLAVVAAIGLREDNGYVLIAWGETTVEMSVAMLVLLAGLIYALLWLAIRLLVGTWRLPARLRAMRRALRHRKARQTLTRGLIEMAEGRWQDSEKSLLRHARHSETPLPHYLMAARAAQAQGAHERRDNHLRLAYETTPAATVAVLLTQAELQIAHGQHERALATLARLRELAPNHGFVLRLLARLHEARGEWDALHALLPELRRHKVFEGDEHDALIAGIYRVRLEDAAARGDAGQADALWSELPRSLRHAPDLVLPYARSLRAAAHGKEAEAVIRGALRKQWDDRLVLLYGQLATGDPSRQLGRAEAWLRERGDTAVLLLTCGRLCMQCGLWGKARSYLESSISAAPRADAWHELARLMHHTGEPTRAAKCTREGLLVALGEQTGISDLPPARTPVQPRSEDPTTRPRKQNAP